MNSPPRNSNFGYKTRGPYSSYNGSHNSSVFTPKTYKNIDGYECVIVLPEHNSTFYRMDKGELPFNPPNNKASEVFGTHRNTYFGVENQDLRTQYKQHTHLYTIKINTPIVLIDMGNKENVEKLMLVAREEIKESINIAFPIENGILTRFSEGASNHKDKLDHDRIVLQHICSLPNIDGYYVDIIGHHPEIGFCAKSLEKLDVIDKKYVNPPILKRRRNNSSNSRTYTGNHIPFSFGDDSSPSSPSPPPKIPRSPFGKPPFEGGKRKTQCKHKTRSKRKPRKTHRNRK